MGANTDLKLGNDDIGDVCIEIEALQVRRPDRNSLRAPIGGSFFDHGRDPAVVHRHLHDPVGNTVMSMFKTTADRSFAGLIRLPLSNEPSRQPSLAVSSDNLSPIESDVRQPKWPFQLKIDPLDDFTPIAACPLFLSSRTIPSRKLTIGVGADKGRAPNHAGLLIQEPHSAPELFMNPALPGPSAITFDPDRAAMWKRLNVLKPPEIVEPKPQWRDGLGLVTEGPRRDRLDRNVACLDLNRHPGG